MMNLTVIDPRTWDIKEMQVKDWVTACRESGITDGCVVGFEENDDRVTAYFVNDNNLPFGITAHGMTAALEAVVKHQDTCRAVNQRVAQAEGLR